jgi:hypothetical protein
VSLLDWAVFVLLSVGVALVSLGARHLWRGTSFDWGANPVWWPWGGAFYRGARRSAVVVVALLATANVVFLLYEVSGSADADALVGPLAPLLGGLTAVVLGLMILNVTIIAYNWPKALVPPPLRDEPGMVEEYERRKRSK